MPVGIVRRWLSSIRTSARSRIWFAIGKATTGFAHRSFREFFVAKRLAELLKKGEAPQIPLTDAVVSFVYHLLAPVAGYEVRIEARHGFGAGPCS